MFSNKGQGTTEYLIILAVIIVIALVVVGVMGWFPGLSTGITEQQSRAYWQSTSPFAIDDWEVSSSGATFSVQNMTTDELRLEDITMGSDALDLTDQNVTAGSSFTTPIDNTVTCTTGNNYSYDIKITYSVAGGIQGKTFTGTKPLIGTCS
ncbi:MAG: class III signal peptide-containing protein [Candidatus Diapherotrites archaeon]|nr:class III signal peptide-containing protein [Candidatus Diapherotrites archaeon]